MLLSCWDYDKTKSNDLIGVAAIALGDIIDAWSLGQGPLFVDEPLLQNGLVMGRVSASVSIRCAGAATASDVRRAFGKADKKPLSHLRRAAGQCDLCCAFM